jgi:hypothetical protein
MTRNRGFADMRLTDYVKTQGPFSNGPYMAFSNLALIER